MFFNVCLHSRSFLLHSISLAEIENSSVDGEPQGNWRWNSNSRDIVASSPSFPHQTPVCPGELTWRLLYFPHPLEKPNADRLVSSVVNSLLISYLATRLVSIHVCSNPSSLNFTEMTLKNHKLFFFLEFGRCSVCAYLSSLTVRWRYASSSSRQSVGGTL